MKGAIGTLIVFYLLQGCLANIIFTALNIENHPCRPENLKVCTYILYHYTYLKISGLTLLIAEILSGKNVRAWVSMDFT